MKTLRFSRRDFLKLGGVTLGTALLSSFDSGYTRARSASTQPFFTGLNYPWIAYGHDFGANGWGHDGLCANGWTYQTWDDSQGFTDTRRSTAKAKTGNYSLAITAALIGKDPHKAQGEVYVNLVDHHPHGVTPPLDLTHVNTHFWVLLPKGSAGWNSARNGVQIIFKSQAAKDAQLYSYYSQWENVQTTWEGTWHEFIANPSNAPGYKDPLFDPAKIVAIGVKMAINKESKATLNGTLYLDSVQLDTTPPIHFDFEEAEITTDLNELYCSVDVLRVFVFADGGASPEFTPAGAIATPGFDAYFYDDFDTLLQAAQERAIKIIPTLLDFGWCFQKKTVGGVDLYGHSDVIRDPVKRQTFLDYALTPFIQRYANRSEIYCIDIINEPEWVIQEVAPGDDADPVLLAQMQEFVLECSDTIHKFSPHLVTVGSARRKWLHYWQGLGLDLYQFHWYENFLVDDNQLPDETFPWLPYSELGLDKPCFIGEVPTDSKLAGTTHRPLNEYLQAAQSGGYSGLLAWSYRALDDYSNFQNAQPYLEDTCTSTYLPVTTR
jgi:hypothetical protein